MMPRPAISIFLIFFICYLPAVLAQEIPEKKSIQLPLMIDDQDRGEVLILAASANDDLEFDASSLLKILKPILSEESFGLFQNNQGQYIKASLLLKNGITAQLNQQEAIVILMVPLEKRNQSSLSLLSKPNEAFRFQRNGLLSGFFNVRGAQIYHHAVDGSSALLDPLSATGDLGLRVGKLSIDSEYSYIERRQTSVQRERSRLIYDDNPQLIRYQLGDIQYASVGFQSFQSIGGFGFSKNENLQPGKLFKQLSRNEILIHRRSQIDIYINGKMQKTFFVEPGRFQLRDLLLQTGVNKVVLKIKDDTGLIEQINLEYLTDVLALPKDYQEFSYQIGFFSEPNDLAGGYDYHLGQGAGSFFHRRGISDTYTLGLNLQSHAKKKGLLGIENVLIAPFGVLSLDLASTDVGDSNFSWGARLGLRTLTNWSRESMSWSYSAGLESYAPDFTPNGELKQNFIGSLRLALGKSLSSHVRLTFNTQFKPSRDKANASDQIEYGTDLNWSISNSWHFNLSTSQSVSDVREDKVMFNLSWLDPLGHQNTQMSGDSTEHERAIQYNRFASGSLGKVQMGALASENDSAQNLTLSSDLRANRLNLTAGHNLRTPKDKATGQTTQTTNLGFGTGLAFVMAETTGNIETEVGVTRPVSEAFALFSQPRHLDQNTVRINPNGDYSESKIDWFGAGVLPDLRAYEATPIQLDTSMLPVNTNVETEFLSVNAPFKGGVWVPLIYERSTTVSGVLKTNRDKTLTLVAGEAKSINGLKTTLPFFTNREGRFVIERAKPGTYKLEFYDLELRNELLINIPEQAQEVLSLGVIEVILVED